MTKTLNIAQNKSNSLYWKCQFFGWGLVSLFWFYIALFRDDFELSDAIINYIFDVAICIAITHAYRTMAVKRKWNQLNIKDLIWKLIPALIILSIMFMIIMNIKTSIYIYLADRQNDSIKELFVWNPFFVWNPVLITGLRHMSIWLLAYHLYHFYQREVQSTKMNAQLSLIAKQAQFDNLSAQLNPHFLFNSLNSIKSLIIENPKIARRAVDLLSDILRSSLYETQDSTVSLEEEMGLVKDYVELEKLRFEERLKFNLEVDERLNHIRILPLSIQLLVENALKHGIDKQLDGGTLELSIKKEGNKAVIKVVNPGTLNIEGDNRIGLKNLKNRLQLKYKGAAQFEINQIENESVLAKLTIPIIE
ncbi:histidine kinase [Marivirga harenae]|uniref:sensor histidine kinase n=1 Tax=Marivirga harenae TaxID=2010992 RepID=UPI0026DF8730|nr:histidine kinase [Marivirga harenae]WKV10625.1 histidine kinase [Marivirga harenae]|tara:strand:- start:598413 stop:599501 length:1089 start_codon:yes stop_codon:yes gene_type:complete